MLWLCILLPRFAPEAAAGGAGQAGAAHLSASGTQAALGTLALWALQWSSQVSERAGSEDQRTIAAAQGAALWLEIGASRALFGDHDILRARVADGLTTLGFSFRLGIAPTPQGATIMARAGPAGIALTRAQLLRQLGPLPLPLLSLPDEQLAALHGVGLRRIGELLALPDAALARRFGPAASLYLQRLRGAVREPQRCVRSPARFASRCEFSGAVSDTTALLFPLQRLLAGLQGYLRSLDRAVQRYTLCLEHHRAAPTRLAIGLARPGRDAAQLLALARERLATTALAAPVHGLGVEADELLQPLVLQGDLFSRAAQQNEQLQQALDRLAARLGQDAVQSLGRAADHRPERAWRSGAVRLVAPDAHSDAAQSDAAQPGAARPPDRPCWLLPEPRRIDMPRELLAGPERIEGGWWDGGDVARDYYLARGEHGAQLWVFNDLRSGVWCLHGLWA